MPWEQERKQQQQSIRNYRVNKRRIPNGKAIFQTEIIELGRTGRCLFFEEGMFVLFGDNVPDTLKDFCHFIDQKKVDGTIKKMEINWLWIRKNISSLP